MKVDGIHLSIPTTSHESSWFDSLGILHLVESSLLSTVALRYLLLTYYYLGRAVLCLLELLMDRHTPLSCMQLSSSSTVRPVSFVSEALR